MTKMFWYNFRTEEGEYIETPSDFRDYISQDSTTQNMYVMLLELGHSRLDAVLKVLTACICGAMEADK